MIFQKVDIVIIIFIIANLICVTRVYKKIKYRICCFSCFSLHNQDFRFIIINSIMHACKNK